jgi:hypothetical protein
MIDKESAKTIALRYLGGQYEGKLEIKEDVVSKLYCPWRQEAPEPKAWIIYAPDLNRSTVGASRYLAISKTTGKIVFDGLVGEQNRNKPQEGKAGH